MSILILLLIGILAAFAFWILTQLLWSSKPAAASSKFIALLTAVLVGGILLLIATGRLHWIAGAAAALFPFLRRGLSLLRWLPFLSQIGNWSIPNWKQAAGASTDNDRKRFVETSTAELHMRLDQETGDIFGKVLKGEFDGKQLDALSETELLKLYGSLQRSDSRRMLETYLDRHHPHLRFTNHDDDAAQANSSHDSSIGEMSVERALQILGLQPKPTRDAVVEAHRRLMQRLHPDKGGSHFLAAELNRAKRVLLDELLDN